MRADEMARNAIYNNQRPEKSDFWRQKKLFLGDQKGQNK